MMEKSKVSLFALVVLSVVGLVFLMTNWVNAAAPADTISYWKLDEDPAPAEYLDSVGTNNGVAGPGAPAPTPGVVPIPTVTVPNTAQLFDGAATGIDVAAPAVDTDFNWAAGASFSIEFWMKTATDRSGAAAAANEVIIGRDDTDGNVGPGVIHWWVGLDKTGPNFAAFVLSDTGVVGPGDINLAVRGTTDIGDGLWHHIVAVRDVAGELRLYVDSTLENTTATGAYAVGFSSDTRKLTMGYMDYGGANFFLDGAIDEVSMYDSAFDQDDVDDHYAAGLAGDGIDTLVDDSGDDDGDDDDDDGGGGSSSSGCFIGTMSE